MRRLVSAAAAAILIGTVMAAPVAADRPAAETSYSACTTGSGTYQFTATWSHTHVASLAVYAYPTNAVGSGGVLVDTIARPKSPAVFSEPASDFAGYSWVYIGFCDNKDAGPLSGRPITDFTSCP